MKTAQNIQLKQLCKNGSDPPVKLNYHILLHTQMINVLLYISDYVCISKTATQKLSLFMSTKKQLDTKKQHRNFLETNSWGCCTSIDR